MHPTGFEPVMFQRKTDYEPVAINPSATDRGAHPEWAATVSCRGGDGNVELVRGLFNRVVRVGVPSGAPFFLPVLIVV